MTGDNAETGRLLAGAAKTMASVRYCWLATLDEASGLNARPMGRVPNEPGEDDWTIRFITDGRSRKASDIRRAGEAALIFQRDSDDAYVALTGRAKLRERASEDRHWKDAYNVYFPTAHDLKSAAFIEVDVARMELWIRGVTPEPFGLRPTVLEREAGGAWRIAQN
ncbi:MAG TPA: pyridoxamine 5'-phosphate oxidase family protein [Roseiarcus sp.]|nr:pyridoxamine 5'-phosphate oxidase family protein [Roseiarcus sp.]